MAIQFLPCSGGFWVCWADAVKEKERKKRGIISSYLRLYKMPCTNYENLTVQMIYPG
jgi:hypothetical protein